MSARRSIEIEGVGHGRAPIPMGCRVHNVVYSSGIPGADPATGELPQAADEQVRLVFANLDAFLGRAGASLGDVVRLTVRVDDDALRAHIDTHWVQRFPDPASRPARHTSVEQLRAGMHVQLEVVAVLEP
jgi:2-iminobutanoate/2-iminopropanoate deaminase